MHGRRTGEVKRPGQSRVPCPVSCIPYPVSRFICPVSRVPYPVVVKKKQVSQPSSQSRSD